MKWYFKVIRNYYCFVGRADRTEFWMFMLFNSIFNIATMAMDNYLGTTFEGELYGYFNLIYLVATFMPSLGVFVRRLHDIGKSGWMSLISFIPLIGVIWMLITLTSSGDSEPNQYGENPI